MWDEVIPVTARTGTAADKKRVWPIMTAQWPGYDDYQAGTDARHSGRAAAPALNESTPMTTTWSVGLGWLSGVLLALGLASGAEGAITVRRHAPVDAFFFHGSYSSAPFSPSDGFGVELWNCPGGEMPVFIADREPLVVCGYDAATGFVLADLAYAVALEPRACDDHGSSCYYRAIPFPPSAGHPAFAHPLRAPRPRQPRLARELRRPLGRDPRPHADAISTISRRSACSCCRIPSSRFPAAAGSARTREPLPRWVPREKCEPPRAPGAKPDRVSERYAEGGAPPSIGDGSRFVAGSHLCEVP